MRLKEVRDLHNRQPFQAMALRLADGHEIDVRHPECLSLNPHYGSCVVLDPASDTTIRVDLRLMAAIRDLPAA